MLDFGKYTFEILISYVGTFSLVAIVIVSTYLDARKVKRDLKNLNTENFMEKYGIHKSALLPARLAGSFVLTTFLMGLYIIYRDGPEKT